MSESPELPPRPAPPRRSADVAAHWLAWFGIGRVLMVTACVALVVFGGYWLVRAPALPPEASLPFAGRSGGSSSIPATTLPPPTTAVAAVDTATDAEPSEPVSGPMVVHVAGAVVGPGVYRLPAGARVHTAIDAAGGTTDAADLDGLNLAAPVADGERVYVPREGEVDPATVPAIVPVPEAERAPGRSDTPLDLNRASATELQALPGVGPATAAAIVDDRERNGPFAAVDDLDRVPGIGPAKLAALRDLVRV